MGSPPDSGPPAAEGLPTVQPPSKSDTSAEYKPPTPDHQLPTPPPLSSLTHDIHPRHSDLPLFACSLVSGLCDSVTVNACNVFVSMQTGNTVFLALGASRQPADEPELWLRSLISIASFALGCLCFSNTRRVGPRRKATLALSFFVQAVAIIIAAGLAQGGVVSEFESVEAAKSSRGQIVLVPIALLAWQFGGQISSSRMLGFGEVPTCVLTSVYCDLMSDPKLLSPFRDNPKRNRRFMAVVSLLVGGIVGGWIQRADRGMIIVLWVAAGIKFGLAIMWAFWKADDGNK